MRIQKIFKLGSIIAAILAVVLLLGFSAIQFVPVEHSNPPVVSEPNWDSPETKALVERACYDCHSNETDWPWYSNVAPVSWVVTDHVYEGRHELNFSEWGRAEGRDSDERDNDEEGEGEEVEEIAEVVREGEMPLPSYLIMHPEAKLTKAETEQLVKGLEATFGAEAHQIDLEQLNHN